MRLAYSTNAYTAHDLLDACARIAALGFAGVEILCDRPHWFPGETAPAAADRLAAHLDRLGLVVSNLNVNTANGFFTPPPPETVFEPSLASADPAWRRWRVDYSIAALELAARVGARNISVTSGRPGTGGPPSRGLALFVDSLCRLCEAAEPLGVRVGIEAEPGLLVERAAEVAWVIDQVGSPLLGANLDIGHALLVGDRPQQTAALLGGRIWNVHVEDIAGGKHYHLVPGQGELPFTEWFQAIDGSGFDGLYTLELYTYTEAPDAAGAQALSWLRSLSGETGP